MSTQAYRDDGDGVERPLDVGERPQRRHARFQCKVLVGGSRIVGMSLNISTGGLYLRILRELVDLDFFSMGTVLDVILELPGISDGVGVNAEIRWTNPNDHDKNGWPALGLGLRFVDVAEPANDKIAEYVEGFRFGGVILTRQSNPFLSEVTASLNKELDLKLCQEPAEVIRSLSGSAAAVLLVVDDDRGAPLSVALLNLLATEMPYAKSKCVLLTNRDGAENADRLFRRRRVFSYVCLPSTHQEIMQAVHSAVDGYALEMDNQRLRYELSRANERLQRENTYLKQRYEGLEDFESIVGNSESLQASLRLLRRARETDVTLHLHGETGTGKELFVRALHFGGPRAKGPFVAQNCAGLSETLLQSTLFGHTRGAFTGAVRDHSGVFTQADGGTLYLDEVAELSPVVQGSLLRVLQERRITPLGATASIPVDIRVVSATHKDLKREVQEGRFREDLFFRLVVMQIDVPPLRRREGDVLILARHLLALLCERYDRDVPGFDADAMAALEAYRWPGNIRELENEIERGVLLSDDGNRITLAELSPAIAEQWMAQNGAVPKQDDKSKTSTPPPNSWSTMSVDIGDTGSFDDAIKNYQRQLIEMALAGTGGNLSRAADELGVERSRLGKLAKRIGVALPKRRGWQKLGS